jgi:bcr-type benzoyl-CoA reductase subunit C
MEEWKKIRTAADDPYAYALELKQNKRNPVVGYFCSYAPEELIHAAGAVPFRIFGTRQNISLAESHLQSYCCSLVRGGLEDALKGNLSFLDGTVFPHTCDSIQRLSDIWRLNAGFKFHLDVVLPVKLDRKSARTYMIDVLNQFKTDLSTALGTEISNEQLTRSILVYNRIRKLLYDIFILRSKNPGIISGGDVYRIIKASMVMDRDELLGLLTGLKEKLSQQPIQLKSNGKKRILLSGGICNHPDIYELIEESGGSVIWDDLCTGTRYAEGMIEKAGDPVEAIAERYMTRMVCPAKYGGLTTRGEHLVNQVKNHRADGVIFLFLKFCDPHSFDYPYLKKYLDDAGIPNMLLEIEEQPPPEGQLKTRFESFMEMI